jgi:uncharacterized protein YndB with AHSA1/START domain
MSDSATTTESTVYVTYIASTPQKVWEGLTSGDFTTPYFFGRSIESDWRAGSPWMLRKPDGSVDVGGTVRTADPPRKLVVSWVVAALDLPEAIVTYDIEDLGGDVVRLTMTEAHPTPIPANLLEGGRRGWPMILSGLKSLLETGKPLAIPTPQPPKT